MHTITARHLKALLLPSFHAGELFTGAVLLPAATVPQGHPGLYGVTVTEDGVTVHPSHVGPTPDFVHAGAQKLTQDVLTRQEQPGVFADRDTTLLGSPWALDPETVLYIGGPVLTGKRDDLEMQLGVEAEPSLKLTGDSGRLSATIRDGQVSAPRYTRTDGSALPRSSTRISAHLNEVAADITAQLATPGSALAELLTHARTFRAVVEHHRALTGHLHLETATDTLKGALGAWRPGRMERP